MVRGILIAVDVVGEVYRSTSGLLASPLRRRLVMTAYGDFFFLP